MEQTFSFHKEDTEVNTEEQKTAQTIDDMWKHHSPALIKS